MSKLEKALLAANSLARPSGFEISASAMLGVTIVYMFAVLSVPLHAPQILIWLAVYPVLQSEISGIGYGKIFLKSLWVLPVIVIIGIFNPFLDSHEAFSIGGICVSRGWISFISITLRGILAVQAVLLMTLTSGFYDICHSLCHFGCPGILVTQIQFTYRYMVVVLDEALGMDRARKARGFGRKNYPLKMWGRMVGQLLIRSYERASRIHQAMLARGFSGRIPASRPHAMSVRSWLFVIVWIFIILFVRYYDLSNFFSSFIPGTR